MKKLEEQLWEKLPIGENSINDLDIFDILNSLFDAEALIDMNEHDLTLALSHVEPEALERYKHRKQLVEQLENMKQELEKQKRNNKFNKGKGAFKRGYGQGNK